MNIRRPGLYLFAAMLTIVCLALPTTLAFATTNKDKTTVTYPTGFAISQPLSEIPIEELANQTGVFPVRPSPLSSHPAAPVEQEAGSRGEI